MNLPDDTLAILAIHEGSLAAVIWDAEELRVTSILVRADGAVGAYRTGMAAVPSVRHLEAAARRIAAGEARPCLSGQASAGWTGIDVRSAQAAMERAAAAGGTLRKAAAALRSRIDPEPWRISATCGLTTGCYDLLRGAGTVSRAIRETYSRHPWIAAGIRPARLAKFVEDGMSPDRTVLKLLARDVWQPEQGARTRVEMSEWPVTLPAIRCMAGYAPDHTPVTRQGLQLLSALPPSWLPAGMDSEFAEVTEALATLVCTDLCRKPEDLPRLLDGARGDLRELARQLGRGDPDMGRGLRARIRPLGDYCYRLSRDLSDLVFPRWPRRIQNVSWIWMHSQLIGGRTLKAVCEASDRWHAHERRIRLAVDGDPSGMTAWPALVPAFAAPNGVWVVPLTDAFQLDAEGLDGLDPDGVLGLAHCIGSYAEACARGKAHVLSVRRACGDGFTRLSTLSVSVGADGRVRVNEHSGHDNQPPGGDAVEAVAAWRDAVERGDLPVDPAAAFREHSPAQEDDRAFPDHGDLSREDRLERALEAWQPLLRRRWQGLPPERITDLLAGTPAKPDPGAGSGIRP